LSPHIKKVQDEPKKEKAMLTRRTFSTIAMGVALALSWAPASAEEAWQSLSAPVAPMAAVESGMADVNGIKMYYAVYGAGDPVLLLHGGLGNADYWGAQINELAKTHKVIAVDSRGHGRSTRDAQKYTYELMTSDMIGVLDHLKIDKVSLVGWSDGGIIGLVMAMKNPERLNRVFAFGANIDPTGVKPTVMEDKVFNAYIAKTAEDYAKLSATPKDFDPFVAAISEMWTKEPNYKPEDIAKITVPVTISDGEHDEAIVPAHTEMMAKAIPGAKLVIMPGLSHFAMWQKPDAFNAAVMEFLK
jgi:pimeloyl-ACP methyl ester carboxylesterase